VADVCINEFTDPTCPWAYSAEPFRLRLQWLFGDELTWSQQMVVLSQTPEEPLEKGLTPEVMSEHFARIAHDHHMPIDTSVRPRTVASLPACRAVVAARRHEEAAAAPLLRGLRVRYFGGELIDEPEVIAAAARDAGLDPERLESWQGEAESEAELGADMVAAREPMPAARVLDHKLANWSGGRRYTCPSYEIVRLSDRVRIAVPGFQPFPVYDVIAANLVPSLGRREPPESVEHLLHWAGKPLATQEVAVVCDIPLERAREELGRVASERHQGSDGFWSLAAEPRPT